MPSRGHQQPVRIATDKPVFVSGGSGFVGRQLLRTLAAAKVQVRALARSPQAAQVVASLGAQPVAGDLGHVELMTHGMADCAVSIHVAAKTNEWGSAADFWATNVTGTRNVIAACAAAKVPKLVHVSTEAVLADGAALVNVDESAPYPPHPKGLYSASKQHGEKAVIAANGADLTTVVVRPRLVWGEDDSALLPGLVAAMRSGRWLWWGDGQHLTSTCHVRNLCEGILLAAQLGRGGEAYFITDGDTLSTRQFLEGLVRTQGLTPRSWRLPRSLAPWAVRLGEGLWRRLPLPGSPPLEATTLALTFTAVTLNDNKARRELGYRGLVSRAEGLKQMRQAAPSKSAIN